MKQWFKNLEMGKPTCERELEKEKERKALLQTILYAL